MPTSRDDNNATPLTIAIASGKGGTGKTTVAVNLAAVAPFPLVLADADVEAPNVHVFAPDASWNPGERASVRVPEIAADRCDMCGNCVTVCRYHALVRLGPKPPPLLNGDLCHSCGGCKLACPQAAITEVPLEIGSIREGTWRGHTLLEGRLDVGQARAEPIIRDLHKRLEPLPAPVKLVDAPPGTTCPTVAAVSDADYVLLVTEPTPFGLHDLRLAVSMLRDLGKPHGVVINRAGIGIAGTAEYCHAEGIPVLAELPFDRRAAEVYARGSVLADDLPAFRERFELLWEALRGAATAATARQGGAA